MPADSHFSSTAEHDAEYRALSVPAVVGLIAGLLSPLAMVDPLIWGLPLLGLIFSSVALRQIARNAPEMTGRKIALAGLTLSILFGVMAATHWASYRWLVNREARQFAQVWFDSLGQDQPHKAYQLTLHPDYRQPLDDMLWEFYRGDPRWDGKLRSYVERPLVRTLLVLGDDCRIRYYSGGSVKRTDAVDEVHQVYAVTREEDGQKKTFFIAMEMKRFKLEDGRAQWQLRRTRRDFVPRSLWGKPNKPPNKNG